MNVFLSSSLYLHINVYAFVRCISLFRRIHVDISSRTQSAFACKMSMRHCVVTV